MTLEQLEERIARKTAARRFIGWFDFSRDGFDMRMCGARAFRIQQRLVGNRITMREALWG